MVLKIALVLSGQPRFYANNDTLIKNIINKYDTDVFFHVWWHQDDVGKTYAVSPWSGVHKKIEVTANVLNDLIKMYNPKAYINEKIKTFASTGDGDYTGNNILSTFYTQRQASLVKQNYEKTTNVTYDYVIRARFDTNLIYFNIQDIKTGYVNVPDNCPNPLVYNDNFSVSTNEEYNKIASLYDHILQYISNGEQVSYEHLFKVHNQLQGLKIYKNPSIIQGFFRN